MSAQASRLSARLAQALRGGRDAPLTSLNVHHKVDCRWHQVQWRFASQAEFDLHTRHGLLHELGVAGNVARAVVRVEDLRADAVYVFRELDTAGFAGAAKSRAVLGDDQRESTAALARDPRLAAALGPLRLFRGGEPFAFASGGEVLLEADGLLLCERRPLVLLNVSQPTPLVPHVADAWLRGVTLQTLLRDPPSVVTSWPHELEAFRAARVLPCLSGVWFAPAVQAAALAAGIVPVVRSGGRFHVPPEAAPLLPHAS